jgi:hypothetical protein
MNRSGENVEPHGYLAAVLSAYLEMPETPSKATAGDRKTARGLLEREVPLPIVQTALVLGSLRRIARPPDYPRLQPIRSLAYFVPVVEELLEAPVSQDYGRYIRTRLRRLTVETLKRQQAQTGDGPENYVSS